MLGWFGSLSLLESAKKKGWRILEENARKKHVLGTRRAEAAEHGTVLFQKGRERSQEQNQNQNPRVRSRCSGSAACAVCTATSQGLSSALVGLPRPSFRLPRCLPHDLCLVLLHSFCLVTASSCFQVAHDPAAGTRGPSLTPRPRAANTPDPTASLAGVSHYGEAPPTGSSSHAPPPTGSLWRGCTGVLSAPIRCD